MTQQAPKTTGIPQIIGLFVFVATAAIFLGATASAVVAGLHTTQQFAMAFSYLVAVVGIVVMFLDVYDLWVRGRRFTPKTSRQLRMIALVAILASMATTLLGRNMTLVVLLLPSIIIYYMTMRPQPATTHGARSGRPRTPSSGTQSSSPSRARQRRGGRKRR